MIWKTSFVAVRGGAAFCRKVHAEERHCCVGWIDDQSIQRRGFYIGAIVRRGCLDLSGIEKLFVLPYLDSISKKRKRDRYGISSLSSEGDGILQGGVIPRS